MRFAALERERERRASLREIGGEVRFAAERGASLRERETEKAALRRARFTLLLCSLAARLNAPRKAARRTR